MTKYPLIILIVIVIISLVSPVLASDSMEMGEAE